MLTLTRNGIYCKKGNFYIDPIRPIKNAIITHGHADHARWGMEKYYATPATCAIMKIRLGKDITCHELNFHDEIKLGKVKIKLIPAGHILGSAQVVIEDESKKAIITGDFKTDPDATVESFETEPCDLLVMETTFALPIYNWIESKEIFSSIHEFWQTNQKKGYHTVLYAYSLGKAQRILNSLNQEQGPIAIHSAIEKMNQIYVNKKRLERNFPVFTNAELDNWNKPGLSIAPPATIDSKWIKKCKKYKEAYISGWMTSKGQARRRNMRGFPLSDHADWKGLNYAVKKFNPSEVWTMHGSTDIFAKHLNDQGIKATSLSKLQLERSE